MTAPDGQCAAYYYKLYDKEFSSLTTQVLVDCSVDGGQLGGNVVAFANGPGTGIGLRWVSSTELEVAIDPRVQISEKTPLAKETEAQYLSKRLRYIYRELTPAEPAWQGCKLDLG